MAEPPDGNRFLVVPYLWAINVDADLGLGPVSVPVELDTGDLLSYAEWGALGYLQWNFNDSFLFTDGMFVAIDTKQFEPLSNQPMVADFGLAEFGYGRHFVVKPDSGPFRELVVSPHVAIFHGSLDAEVSGTFDMKIEEAWTGVAFGATVSAPVTSRLTFTLRAVYSGFSSDLQDYTNALVAVRYRLSDKVTLGLGYRLMNANYENDGIVADLDLDGALLGLELSW